MCFYHKCLSGTSLIDKTLKYIPIVAKHVLEVIMAYVIMRKDEIVHVLVLNNTPTSNEQRDILALFGGDRIVKVTCDAADEALDVIFGYSVAVVSV